MKRWMEYSDNERDMLSMQQLHDIAMMECGETVDLAIREMLGRVKDLENCSDKVLRKLASDREERKIDGASEGITLLKSLYDSLKDNMDSIRDIVKGVTG
jgi:Na+/phosphate symporter